MFLRRELVMDSHSGSMLNSAARVQAYGCQHRRLSRSLIGIKFVVYSRILCSSSRDRYWKERCCWWLIEGEKRMPLWNWFHWLNSINSSDKVTTSRSTSTSMAQASHRTTLWTWRIHISAIQDKSHRHLARPINHQVRCIGTRTMLSKAREVRMGKSMRHVEHNWNSFCATSSSLRSSPCRCESPEYYKCKRSRRSDSRSADNNESKSKSHDNR